MAGLVGIHPKDIVTMDTMAPLDAVDPHRKIRTAIRDGLPIIKPMYHTPILVPKKAGGGVEWRIARFGLSRRFSSFNARSEKLQESRLWKSFFGHAHGVAALSYIVEWQKEGAERVPYLISRADGGMLLTPALAAPCLDDKEDLGFAICTRTPNGFFSHFHDRMVGVMTEALMERWLTPEGVSASKLMECVRAPGEDELVARRGVGDLMKRDASDVTPIETMGEALRAHDVEGKASPLKKAGRQKRLGE
jgi:putative SOS response-associated peptidase YedK